MVKQQKHHPPEFSQGFKPLLFKVRNQEKRILQGGFAELEGVLWTSLFFFILASFAGLLLQIENNSQVQLKEFQIEWNKIEE